MKILIVQIGRIGDMILTTPMFRALNEQFPEAEIHVLASRVNNSIPRLSPRIEKVFIYNKNLFSYIKLIRNLRKEKYTIWIDTKDHRSREGKLLVQLVAPETSLGWNNGEDIFDVSLPEEISQSHLHLVEKNIIALKALGVEHEYKQPELHWTNETYQKIKTIQPKNVKSIVLNISASHQDRFWALNNWEKVLLHIVDKTDKVIITSSPDDRYKARELTKLNSEKIVHLESDSIHDVMCAVSQSQLVITPDTSIVHICSAFNTPIIALFPKSEWNYNKFRPLSSDAQVVFPPDESTGLVKDVLLDDVMEAFNTILEKKPEIFTV